MLMRAPKRDRKKLCHSKVHHYFSCLHITIQTFFLMKIRYLRICAFKALLKSERNIVTLHFDTHIHATLVVYGTLSVCVQVR